MSLAIDSTYLAQNFLPWIQRSIDDYYPGQSGRWEVYRVCAHATVIHDAPTIERFTDLLAKDIDLVKREAQDWRPDPDDDLDEVEVLHHLKHYVKTSPLLEQAFSQADNSIASTTLVTSVAKQSPSLAAHAQGRSISCFGRYSHALYVLLDSQGSLLQSSARPQNIFFDGYGRHRFLWFASRLKVVGASSTGNEPTVVWHMQFDFVDLLSRRSHSNLRPGKRRRTTLNPFHRVTSPPLQESSPQRHHLPEAKRFKGVRYRPERRTWTAEMRPLKHSNKLWFGEFKSPAQAARAIDAAFHYYDKPHLLNFPDTPRILSTRPSPPEGVLNEEDKLRFVKEQGKWLASMASTLPSCSPGVYSDLPVSLSRDRIASPSEFRSFAEIASFLSCGDSNADEADDGISQPPPSLDTDPTGGLLGNVLMESDYVGADAVGALIGTLEERQGVVEWNLETFADPSLSGPSSPSSSVHITDGWDGAEHSTTPALWNLRYSAQPSDCESQRSWLNSLLMSPPAARSPMPSSPSQIQRNNSHPLLEQSSFGAELVSD